MARLQVIFETLMRMPNFLDILSHYDRLKITINVAGEKIVPTVEIVLDSTNLT